MAAGRAPTGGEFSPPLVRMHSGTKDPAFDKKSATKTKWMSM
jgi:hypothetical protein